MYHVMNRGNQREAIFTDDPDRCLFLETLSEACTKTDWQLHAWCLMSNHFHLVTETPRGNLVAGMQWFLGVYTNRFNHLRKEFGHGRYKALPGGQRQRLFQGGMPLRAFEPGACRPARARATTGNLSLELTPLGQSTPPRDRPLAHGISAQLPACF